MLKSILSALVLCALLAPIAASAQVNPDTIPDNTRLRAYTVLVSARDADRLRREHFDISAVRGSVGTSLRLEVIMTETDAESLRAQGIAVSLNPGQDDGARARTLQGATAGPVFRPYGGAGGLP